MENIFVPLSVITDILQNHFSFEEEDLLEFLDALSITNSFVMEKKPLSGIISPKPAASVPKTSIPMEEKKEDPVVPKPKKVSVPVVVPKKSSIPVEGNKRKSSVPVVEEKQEEPPVPKTKKAVSPPSVVPKKSPVPEVVPEVVPKTSIPIEEKKEDPVVPKIILNNPNISLKMVFDTLKMFEMGEDQFKQIINKIPKKYLD